MDGLDEQEIEGIWQRIKIYINLQKIKSIDKLNQKEELQKAMQIRTAGDDKNPQGNMGFLINRGFPKEAIENQKIRDEILGANIRQLSVKGITRFQIAKGAQSFISDGKPVRAGRFLKGTNKETALKDLRSL